MVCDFFKRPLCLGNQSTKGAGLGTSLWAGFLPSLWRIWTVKFRGRWEGVRGGLIIDNILALNGYCLNKYGCFVLVKKGHSEFALKSSGADTGWNDMMQRWLNWLLWEMHISNKKCYWNPQHNMRPNTPQVSTTVSWNVHSKTMYVKKSTEQNCRPWRWSCVYLVPGLMNLQRL